MYKRLQIKIMINKRGTRDKIIKIDGSFGEGGGQILRSALALSTMTKRPFEMFNIRAGRKKPGLAPQHLQCVRAMVSVCNGDVSGAHIGSLNLKFYPGAVSNGDYSFNIGTAGSVSLVMQTIFLPLSFYCGVSTVTIKGGTHVPFSPCFHYIKEQWLFFMNRMGFNADVKMVRAGFFPKGGGEINVFFKDAGKVDPLILINRGELVGIRGISAVGNLEMDIAKRQKRQGVKRLSDMGIDIMPEISIISMPAIGKGTIFMLICEFTNSRCCYFGLGAIGKPAEKVADEACDGLRDFLESGGAIDEHLADQVILPLSFADGMSRFTTSKITRHLLTNAEIIKMFSNRKIEIKGKPGEKGEVVIEA